jgi:hypothetical protein
MSVADLERISYPVPSLRPVTGRWSRIRLALMASWCAAELDRQLAAGASPMTNALLAIRGQRLTSRRYRARVTAGLTRAVRDAEEPRTLGFSAAVGPHECEVIAARTVFATLERRLRAPEPVSAEGVARLESLLTDGTSPLYRPAEPGALASGLRAAAAALEPSARHYPVSAGQETVR